MRIIKFFVITGLLIFAQLGTFAQETPAGKKFAISFWKAIEGEKEYAAKSALEAVKKREPNFDASKMEKALAEMISKRQNEKTTANNNLTSKIEADKILSNLFERNIQADSFDTESEIKSSISENNKLTEQILAMDKTLIQKELDSILRRVKSTLSVSDRDKDKLVTRITKSLDGKQAQSMYYELLLRQSYWDNARRVFPDEADITAAYTAISNDISSLGTLDQRIAKSLKNLNAKIDAERMPKPALRDASLEKWFKDVFQSQTAIRGNNYTFLKATITSTDYLLKRNELTGIILSRSRGAHIAFKTSDGKCFHGIYGIVQQYVGGSFTGATLTQDFNNAEMRCENVNK